MSRFTDYAAKMRQVQTPFNGGLQPYLQQRDRIRQASPLFNTEKALEIAPAVMTPSEQIVEQPQIDTSNAIGSLATLLGPTPAEREARERRMLENKSKMQAWTGLFDGLRQLGNLYYTTKGATPQQLASPYQAVEQQYQQQRALEDSIDNYARQYNTSLYNLRRQIDQDRMAQEKHKATLDYYKNRDEMNAEKVAIQRFKADTDAAYKNATLEQKERMNDIMADVYAGRIDLMEAQRRLANVRAAHVGQGSSGGRNGNTEEETVEWIDKEGQKHRKKTKVNSAGNGNGNSSGNGKVKVNW